MDDLADALVRLRDSAGWLEVAAAVADREIKAAGRDTEAVQRLDTLLGRARLDALRAIVAAHGWPHVGLVGPAGAQAAVDLLLTAEPDVAFLRRCRDLVAEAAERGEVPAWHRAYVEDRLAVLEDGTQRYGTRLRWTGDGWEPLPSADAAVDRRRAEVGLPPLHEVREGGRE